MHAGPRRREPAQQKHDRIRGRESGLLTVSGLSDKEQAPMWTGSRKEGA